MKKKIIAVAMAAAMVFTFAACGSSGSGGSASNNSNGKAEYTLKLSSAYPEDHNDTQAAQAAADEIEEKTNGAVKIQVYPANQLGDITQVYEEVMKGTIDMSLGGIPTQFDERLEMQTIPYLVTNYDEANKMFAQGSVWYDQFEKVNNDIGTEILGVCLDGFMGIGSVKQLSDPIAINGKHNELLRIPAADTYKSVAETFGFNTTTIAYADLYSALQTGVADGWIGGSAYVNNESFGDLIKYFADDRYIMEVIPIAINKNLFDGMPEEYQKIIKDAFADACLDASNKREKLDNDAMDDMKSKGATIYEPTQDELDTAAAYFKENVWPTLEDSIGKDVMDQLKSVNS